MAPARRSNGEKPNRALRVRYLHGYHGVVPPMALIALYARVPRSTNRSTPYYGDHQKPVTECHRGQGLDKRELPQAGDVVDLDFPPFFIDRVEDAVASGPQAPQIRRPVRERLGRPRLIGEPPARVRPVCFKGATGRPLVRP